MVIGTTIYVDMIVSDPDTAEPVDADAAPNVDVFENDNDTPILNIISVKRGSYTGNYRVKVDATTSNGFSEGKSYSLIANAYVDGTFGKSVISNFIIDDMNTILKVAKDLYVPVQEDFIPVMVIPEPIEPPSLESQFGIESSNSIEVIGLFQRWYDLNTNTWIAGNDVNLELKGEVGAAYEAIVIYNEAKVIYDNEYNLQKHIQWKIKCADALIAKAY